MTDPRTEARDDGGWDLPPNPPYCGECKALIGFDHRDGCSGQYDGDLVTERDKTRGQG